MESPDRETLDASGRDPLRPEVVEAALAERYKRDREIPFGGASSRPAHVALLSRRVSEVERVGGGIVRRAGRAAAVTTPDTGGSARR